MDRAGALAYIEAEFGSSATPYLRLAGVTVDDTGPVASILNSAFLRMGVAYSALGTASIDDLNALAFMAVLRYETLRWLWNNLNGLLDRAKVGAGQGVSVDATVWRQEFRSKIEAAAVEALSYGIVLPGLELTGWQTLDPNAGPTGLNLNYLQGA
jgi:hypothetical protein